jgi:hypothetical protein
VYHWFALPIAHIPEDEKVISMHVLQIFSRDCMLYQAMYPTIGHASERVGKTIKLTILPHAQ